jgi:hypothetical protein
VDPDVIALSNVLPFCFGKLLLVKAVWKLRVICLIWFPSFVVFKAFSNHAEHEDEEEGRDCAEGVEWGDEWDALEYGADEEVYIGVAFELDDECQWQEGDQVVLGGWYVVGPCFFWLGTRYFDNKL